MMFGDCREPLDQRRQIGMFAGLHQTEMALGQCPPPLAPRCPATPLVPSNSPMTPSITKMSAPVEACAAMASSSGRDIAQESRLTLGAAVAAAWNAGSI